MSNAFILYFDLVLLLLLLTSVEDLLDDSGHLSLQHGVEHLDDEDEAGAEHQQRQSQQDHPYSQIGQIHVRKEVWTCICSKANWSLQKNSDSDSRQYFFL